MKKTWILYMVMFAVHLAGCSVYEAGECPSETAGGVSVTIHLSVPGEKYARAAEYEEVPFGNDYYIYSGDVKVVVFNTDGTYKDHGTISFVTATNSYHLYTLTAKLEKFEEADLGKNYKIVVIANIDGQTKIPFPAADVLATLTEQELYGRLASGYNDCLALTSAIIAKQTDGRIPMWGSLTTMIEDDTLAEIDMMRAFAKVQVKLSQELRNEGYSITDVRLINSRAYAWLTPLNAHVAAYTEATYVAGTDYTEANVYTTIGGLTIAPFRQEGDDYYAYIPEQDANTGLADDKQRILVSVSKGTEIIGYDYPIYFARYDSSGKLDSAKPYAVLRNHHYVFNITGVLPPYDLQLTCTVQPWGVNEETWDYSDQLSVQEGGKMSWTDGTYAAMDTGTATVLLYPNRTQAQCTFTIDTPMGATWHASLETIAGANNAFEIVGASSGEVGTPATLTIRETEANHEAGNSAQALLRIAVLTADGRTILAKELLPSGVGTSETDYYTIAIQH